MTERPRQTANVAGARIENAASSGVKGNGAVRTFVLSTAKNGHVNQCVAVADLIDVDIEKVFQVPGSNKTLPQWRKDIEKPRWLFAALLMVWKMKRGKILVLASGRSVLLACHLLKLLRGNNVYIVYVGSPRTWTKRSADVMLRANHEREVDQDEDNRYPWKPKQVWVDAPISRPLPVSEAPQKGVVVLLGGLNATYGDEAADYDAFLDELQTLAATHSVSIAFSRRTKAKVKKTVEKRLGRANVTIVDATDRQGFLTACEGAGAFVVTPDSITMVAEACATGKPVYTANLPIKNRDTSNHRFIETNIKEGHVEQFCGTVNFERRAVCRADVEAAQRDLVNYIEAWKRASST